VFYALAPVILSLYVSTFFLRYHYMTDSVVGILTAVFVILSAPSLVKAWNSAVKGKGTSA
jgi:membrane-associated phospholipid phosphatase